MNHQDLIYTCVFEQIQGLLFSDLSGPLRILMDLKQNISEYFWIQGVIDHISQKSWLRSCNLTKEKQMIYQ